MLTADEVLTKRFPATKFREGYDSSAVDDFLDKITLTLRGYQSGAGLAAGGVTSEQVTEQKFAATKFRGGYEVDAVDTFLDEVSLTLRAWETPQAPAAPAAPLTGYAPLHAAPAAVDPVAQQWAPPTSAPAAPQPGVSLHDLVNELQRSMVLAGAQRSLPVLVEAPDGRRLPVHDVVVVDGHAVVRVG